MENPAAPQSTIFINNAGLVLLNPFLPRLFQVLSLVNNGGFVDEAAQFKAIVLLQYAATGSVDVVGHDTTLNKLLCALTPGTTVQAVTLSDEEKTTVDQMLQAVIQHWDKLRNTSVNGLRETFLHREGKLEHKEDAWQLTVPPKPYDVLLDTLPWSFSVVKYAWIPEPVYVRWR